MEGLCRGRMERKGNDLLNGGDVMYVKVFCTLSYLFVILGSIGMLEYANEFPLATTKVDRERRGSPASRSGAEKHSGCTF